MKKNLMFIAVAIMALVLVACGGGKKVRIGVVMPDAKEERWQQQDGKFIEEAIKAAGKEYTFDILYSDGDENTEKANVDALISRGAEVIIMTAHGSGAGALAAAKAAGVPLIAHDRMAKSATQVADYYTTFNSWNVGKAQGQHLVDMALADGATATNKVDLAVYAGRTADWPNATYFFGGAMEALHPHLDKFNIITNNKTQVEAIGAANLITEANFNDAAKDLLQKAMQTVDTDWNAATAKSLAEATVSSIDSADHSAKNAYVLAPNDDTSAAIRLEFAKLTKPYAKYYTTGQDASNVALASLMGDTEAGQGTQTMTVFKDTRKLSQDSVKIAINILNGEDGLKGLTGGPKIDGAPTAYTPIDTLLASTPQATYDLIFKTGFKNKNESIFSKIDFTKYEK